MLYYRIAGKVYNLPYDNGSPADFVDIRIDPLEEILILYL